MTKYTAKLVTELQDQESWTFEEAAMFANINSLSTRSVVSKIKSLGINYVPKAKTVSTSGPRVTKADLVQELVSATKGDPDELSGLEGANRRALVALLKLI